MVILGVVLGVIILLLTLRLVGMKKQIASMTNQLDDLTCGRTEKYINLMLIDDDLNDLAVKINDNMEKQRQLLIDKNRHERQFKESIANISHDLRTPLTAIIGYLQMLKKSELSEKQAGQTEIIMKKAVAMQRLVEVFFELSVIESETVLPQYETINLSNVLMDAVVDYAPRFEMRGIEPKIIVPEKSVTVMGDEVYLKRMVQNLLGNAIEYGQHIVTVALTVDGAEVVLQITNDTELEITNPELLFDRFYTGDFSRNGNGTGLGLYIVKLLTEKQGGTVNALFLKGCLTITISLKKEAQSAF